MADAVYRILVLTRRDQGESDRVITAFTQEAGKLDFVLKGARKGSSRLAGVSEPLAAATIQAAPGRSRQYVTQAQMSRGYPGLRADYSRLMLGLALSEALAAVLPYEMEDRTTWDIASESLAQLEDHPEPWIPFLWGSLRLLDAAGLLPHLDRCSACECEVRREQVWFDAARGGTFCTDHHPDARTGEWCEGRALLGLSQLEKIVSPPPTMKCLPGAAKIIHRCWLAAAEKPLPTLETCMKHLLLRRKDG